MNKVDARRPRSSRLCTDADFARTMHGIRIGDERMTLRISLNGLRITRMGQRVGKALGPAVARNRAKRMFREAFRLRRSALPIGLDIVFMPKIRIAPELNGYLESITRLVGEAARRLT